VIENTEFSLENTEKHWKNNENLEKSWNTGEIYLIICK